MGERQDGLSERQDDRQKSIKKQQDKYWNNRHHAREDWQNFYEDNYFYSGRYAASWVVGVGFLYTAVAFAALPHHSTVVVVHDVTYYHCGGVYYQQVSHQGNVTYVVVESPH